MDKDNAKKNVAAGYLAAAKRDLDMLSSNVDNPKAADELMGFLAQQTVEKAVKTVLALNGIDFSKTHDLFNLIVLCKDNGIKIPELSHNPEFLTRFAVEMRYIAFYDEAVELDVKAVLKDAQTFFDWAGRIVGE
jgi:HEPN domain-containing protein